MPEIPAYFNMRMSPKVRYLLDIAARLQNVKLTDFVESAIVAALDQVTVIDEREANPGQNGSLLPIHGKSLAKFGDEIWSSDHATLFVNLVARAPWLLSDGEIKLLRIVQHSDYFAPSGVLNLARIKEHWPTLEAIRDGEAELDILADEQRPSPAMAYGVRSEAENVALYKADHAKWQRERDAYNKAKKGRK